MACWLFAGRRRAVAKLWPLVAVRPPVPWQPVCDPSRSLASADFFGGVPRSILYDNTKLAVARILGGERQRTRAFAELQSHYLFLDRFGRPGKGNDKGKVEGLVGYPRAREAD